MLINIFIDHQPRIYLTEAVKANNGLQAQALCNCEAQKRGIPSNQVKWVKTQKSGL